MRRFTFAGPMDGFSSPGPDDHVKVFFPDPVTGELHAPRLTPTGIERPDGVALIARDYTPLVGPDGALQIDFVLHSDAGPAAQWAQRAKVGDEIVVAGPRGSELAPNRAGAYLIGGDETALPAIARWLEVIDPEVPVTVLIEVAAVGDEAYPLPRHGGSRTVRWLYRGRAAPGGGSLLDEAVRALGALGADGAPVFCWFAGEASSLVAVRRYLRTELGLERSAVDVHGYWRRGTANHDHHAPVDPQDEWA